MTIRLTWEFPEISFRQENDKKIITDVTYKIIASDGENSAEYVASVTLPAPDDNFVDYQNVTHKDVVDWINKRFPEIYKACEVNLSGRLNIIANEKKNNISNPHFSVSSTPAQ